MTPREALAQALTEVARRHSFDPNDTPLGVLAPAILAALPDGWALTKPRWERITDAVMEEVRADGAQQERERLRALHRTWDGHPPAYASCGVCEVLLSDPDR